jgi:hypothetical protein
MKVVAPLAVSDDVLTSSSVAETDYPQWNSGTSYAKGSRVLRNDEHLVYESVVSTNLGNDPLLTVPSKWMIVGATNRWAMFDEAVGSTTDAVTSIVVVLTPGTLVDAIGILDTDAASVRVQVNVESVDIYDVTKPGVGSIEEPDSILFLDLPADIDAVITVTVEATGSGEPVAVGTLILGPLLDLGITEAGPTVGINDFSRRETDDFGVTTILERAWAKRMSVRTLVDTDTVDDVQARLAALRARPSLWIGEEQYDSLTIYGTYKDFSIDLQLETISFCTLTIEGLTKATEIQAVESPLSAFLTNETHTLAATPGGDVISYAGAAGTFRIFNGLADVSEFFELSTQANPQSLAVTYDEQDYSVTGGLDAGEPSATLTIRATGVAHFAGITLDKTFSLSKSTGGANAKLMTVISDRQVIAYDAAGAPSPTTQTTTFATNKQNTVAVVNWSITDAAGVPRTPVTTYLSAASGDSVTMSEPQFDAARNGTSGVIVTATLSDGVVITDSISVVRARSGANGVNALAAFLTNESHTVPADSGGNVTSYTGASGEFMVFSGTVDVSALFTLSSAANPQSLTVGYSGNDYSITGGLDAGEAGATLTIRATGSGAFAGITIDKVFSLAKSGAGAAGAAAKLMTALSDRQTIAYDETGAPTPSTQTTTFATNKQNTSGTVNWTIADANGVNRTPVTSYLSAASGDSVTMSEPQFDAARNGTSGVTVTATLVDGITLVDKISVVRVQKGATGAAGANAIVGFLTNEAHTVPADASGNVTSYSGASGDFTVFSGAANVSSLFSLSTLSNTQGLTIGYSSQTYTVTGGLDAGEPNAAVVIRATGSGAYAGVTLDKIFSLGKANAGANGANAKTLTVLSDRQTIAYDSAGNPTPSTQTTTFGTNKQNTTGTVNWTITDADGTPRTPVTTYLSAASGDSVTMSESQFNAARNGTSGVIVTGSITDGTTFSDRISVVRVQAGAAGAAGANAIVAYLTNETHTVPADAAGNVVSYTGASGNFTVFSGAANVSALFSLSTQSNSQGLTIGYAGQTYSVTGGLDAGEPTAAVVIRATGSGAYAGVTLDKIFTLSKANAGANGANAKTLTVLSDRQTIAYDSAGNPTPSTQTTTFGTNKQNTTGTVNWSLTDANGSPRTPVTTYLSAASGDSVTMTEAQFNSARNGTSGVIVTGSITDGSTFSDRISVVRVQAGANGADGSDGSDGVDGVTYFPWYAYADSADGTLNFTTGAPGNRGYVGFAVGTTSTESTNPAVYTWSRYVGPAAFGLAASAGAAYSGNKIFRTTAFSSAWDQAVWSTEAFRSGAYLSFVPTSVGAFMLGLNTDPITDQSYVTLDYALYPEGGTGNLFCSESSTITLISTWAPGDNLAIHYDNASVKYYKNGTVIRTVAAPADLLLYIDSAALLPGELATITAFTAAGPRGTNGTNGTNGDDGFSAIVVSVTVPAYSVPCTYSGAPLATAFDNAHGLITVRYEGGDVTASCTFAEVGQNACVGDINTSMDEIFAGAKGAYRVTSISADTATYTMSVSYTPPGGAAQSQTVTMQLAKAKGGPAAYSKNAPTVNTSIALPNNGGAGYSVDGFGNYSVSSGSGRMQIKAQYSFDNSTWNDIAGTTVTGDPAFVGEPSGVATSGFLDAATAGANDPVYLRLLATTFSGSPSLIGGTGQQSTTASWA